MKKLIKQLSFALLILNSINMYAAPGDTTWVNANVVNLDYYNDFDTRVGFPNGSISYRKVLMKFTLGEYNCGSATYCHQWDYTVNNYLLTATDTVELSRLITPYATTGAPRFPSTWKKDYIFDVTDFYPLLKDSATVRIHYSGYSGGFTANVKFAFIEGTPPRNVLGMKHLWSGYFNYGDASNPIASHLNPYTLTPPANTQSSELKYTVTGHGSDATSQCCEFNTVNSGHNYSILVNNTVIDTKNIWRDDCGSNELYAQGGTWIYNRANWCPGNSVAPFNHVLGITSGSFTLGNTYDNYTSSGNYGGYDINGEVIYYGAFNHTIDASIEEVIAPNNYDDYFRENPSGSSPIIRVRNTGSSTINTIKFQYNVKDSVATEYIWTGILLPLADLKITLPDLNTLTNMSLNSASGIFTFEVKVALVNGVADEDQTNNSYTSQFVAAPVWPKKIVITFKTNSAGTGGVGVSPSETSWQITDLNNNVVASRIDVDVSTTYIDTVTFANTGFYKLTITDLGCDGLHWWVWDQNPSYGITAGSFIVKKYSPASTIPMHGYYYSGSYNNDFGCEFSQYFTTNINTPLGVMDINETSANYDVYPNPSSGFFTLTANKKVNKAMEVKVLSITGELVKKIQWYGQTTELNLSDYPKGIYMMQIVSEDRVENKKLIIE